MRYGIICLILLFCQISFAQSSGERSLFQFKIKKNQLSRWLSPANLDQPIIAAHRGGRNIPGYPENAIETFEYVLSQVPAIMECDVEMTADSVLILLHDQTLDRTTTGSGKIKETPYIIVDQLKLIDDFGDTTNFEIPTLAEALKWCKKKTILELDVKRGVPFDRVVEAIKNYKVEDYVIIITYNQADAQKVYELNPDLMISVGMRNEDELAWIEKSGIPSENLIAFTGTRLSPKSLYQKIHKFGALAILGTLGNLDKKAIANGDEFYMDCIKMGIDVLATDRPIEVAKAIGVVKQQKRRNKFYNLIFK